MKYRNSKLFKALMLSAMAMVIMSAHRVTAAESPIYKCMNSKGGIVFQDFACRDDLLMEKLKIEMNQSADIVPGLRPLEKQMLSQSKAKYQPAHKQDKAIENLIIVAIYNSVANKHRQ